MVYPSLEFIGIQYKLGYMYFVWYVQICVQCTRSEEQKVDIPYIVGKLYVLNHVDSWYSNSIGNVIAFWLRLINATERGMPADRVLQIQEYKAAYKAENWA